MRWLQPVRIVCGLLAAFLLWLGCTPSRPQALPRRDFENVIVVVVDSLRSDALPSYGYAHNTAPFLWQMSREGVQLQGYSSSSWARPSVATLLTGLQPQRHQAVRRRDALPASVPTLAQILKRAGFHTAAWVTNPEVGRAIGFDRGYASFWQSVRQAPSPAFEVVDEILSGDERASRFYLHVHLMDPRGPYVPWDSAEQRNEGSEPTPLLVDYARGRQRLDAEALASIRSQYDASILETDRELERLFTSLNKKGMLDDTLVVVTSNHGQAFGEHGSLAHGSTLYEESVRVPFLLWSSDWERRGLPRLISNDPFAQVDFLPTVLQALGVSASLDLDGVERWSGLRAGRYVPPAELLFHLELDGRRALALRSGDLKVISQRNRGVDAAFDLSNGGAGEEKSLGPDDPRLLSLEQRLRREDRELTARAHAQSDLRLSKDFLEELRVIGDLQDVSRPPRWGNTDRSLPEYPGIDWVLDLRDPSQRLVAGWSPPDGEGRWSAARSSFMLPVPPGARELVLVGRAPAERASTTLRVRIHDARPVVVSVAPGAAELRIPVPEGLAPWQVVSVELVTWPSLEVADSDEPVGLHWTAIGVTL